MSFVLGIDDSPDNIDNRVDGACARYLNFKKTHKHVPDSLFVTGNSSLNIRNGSAMRTDKGVHLIKAVFGEGGKDENVLEKVLSNNMDEHRVDLMLHLVNLRYIISSKI